MTVAIASLFRKSFAATAASVALLLFVAVVPANAFEAPHGRPVASFQVLADNFTAGTDSEEPSQTLATSGAVFSDVSPATQFYAEISWLSAQGVSTGWIEADGSRTYRPLQNVNRDAMAAFMYRLAGSPPYSAPEVPPFRDVPKGAQFYKEIAWLAERGVTSGWVETDGLKTFRPLAAVNRDAMAAFMYRFADGASDSQVNETPFSDVQPNNQFYREVTWLASKRITTGWTQPDGTRIFAPLTPVHRDAMAAFMFRLDQVKGSSRVLTGTPTPQISGSLQVGQSLSVEVGMWEPAPVAVTLQWNRDGVPVSGATASTYTLTAADEGKRITVTAVGSKPGYEAASVTSQASTPVLPPPGPVPEIIRIAADISTDTTWSKAGAVYVIDLPSKQPLKVMPGATLTVGSGVIVKSAASTAIMIEGRLEVLGEANARAVITSLSDDSVGGDSGQDGPTTANAVQVASALTTSAAIDARFLHIIGSIDAPCGPLQVSDSIVTTGIFASFNGYYGGAIICHSDTPVVSILRSTIGTSVWRGSANYRELANTVLVHRYASVTVSDNTILGPVRVIGHTGFNQKAGGIVGPGVLTLDRNKVALQTNPPQQEWNGMYVRECQGANDCPLAAPAMHVQDNTVIGNFLNPLSLDGVLDGGSISGNSLSGGSDTLSLTGVIRTSLTAPVGDLKTKLDFLVVAQGGTVTVAPGSTVTTSGMRVYGDLRADGTPTAPIVLNAGQNAVGDPVFGFDIKETGTASFTNVEFHRLRSISTSGRLTVHQSRFVKPFGSYLAFNDPLKGHQPVVIRQYKGQSFIDASFEDAPTLLTVAEGEAVLRGRVVNPFPEISLVRTCSWQSHKCALDARNFDWGTTDGPFVTGKLSDGSGLDKPLLACGVVLTMPWAGITANETRAPWSIGNCPGTADTYEPAQIISRGQKAFHAALSPYEQTCASPSSAAQDACDVVAKQQACLAGAKQIVESQSTFPIIRDGDDAAEFAASSAADYLKELDFPAKSTAGAASVGFQMLSAARSISAVASAYDSCRP